MSDKTNDTRTDAERARDEGMAALDKAQEKATSNASSTQSRGNDAGAKASDALSGAKELFNKLKARITGGR